MELGIKYKENTIVGTFLVKSNTNLACVNDMWEMKIVI